MADTIPVGQLPLASSPNDSYLLIVSQNGEAKRLRWADVERSLTFFAGDQPAAKHTPGRENQIRSSRSPNAAGFLHDGVFWRPVATVGPSGGVLVRGGPTGYAELVVNEQGAVSAQPVSIPLADSWEWAPGNSVPEITFLNVFNNNIQLEHGRRYVVSTAGGSFTVRLPTTPAVGQFLEISDADGSWSVNSLILEGNVEGNAGGVAFDLPATVRPVWDGTTWRLQISAHAPMSAVQFVPPPLTHDDASMFGGEFPGAGLYLALSSTHLYILKGGWEAWRRASIDSFVGPSGV